LTSTTSPDERVDFLRRLQTIQEDPQVKNLARYRARNPDLAEDALQETFYAIARVKYPERIRDLRAYFCQVLIREIYRLHGQLGATLVDDFAAVADALQGKPGGQSVAPSVVDMVNRDLLACTWRKRFAAQHAYLVQKVPGRSGNPGRYRDLIVAVAERTLISLVSGDDSDPDGTVALCAAYPEWFAERGCAVANAQQRVSRGRADVNIVLRLVVNRADLRP
jgi:hypothetical protein